MTAREEVRTRIDSLRELSTQHGLPDGDEEAVIDRASRYYGGDGPLLAAVLIVEAARAQRQTATTVKRLNNLYRKGRWIVAVVGSVVIAILGYFNLKAWITVAGVEEEAKKSIEQVHDQSRRLNVALIQLAETHVTLRALTDTLQKQFQTSLEKFNSERSEITDRFEGRVDQLIGSLVRLQLQQLMLEAARVMDAQEDDGRWPNITEALHALRRAEAMLCQLRATGHKTHDKDVADFIRKTQQGVSSLSSLLKVCESAARYRESERLPYASRTARKAAWETGLKSLDSAAEELRQLLLSKPEDRTNQELMNELAVATELPDGLRKALDRFGDRSIAYAHFIRGMVQIRRYVNFTRDEHFLLSAEKELKEAVQHPALTWTINFNLGVARAYHAEDHVAKRNTDEYLRRIREAREAYDESLWRTEIPGRVESTKNNIADLCYNRALILCDALDKTKESRYASEAEESLKVAEETLKELADARAKLPQVLGTLADVAFARIRLQRESWRKRNKDERQSEFGNLIAKVKAAGTVGAYQRLRSDKFFEELRPYRTALDILFENESKDARQAHEKEILDAAQVAQ